MALMQVDAGLLVEQFKSVALLFFSSPALYKEKILLSNGSHFEVYC